MKRNTVAALSVLAVLALMSAPIAKAGQQTRSASERSYREARKVLDAAIEAMGGLQALRSVKDISRSGTGTGYNQGQSLKADAPYTTRPVKLTTVTDLAGKRGRLEFTSVFQGGFDARILGVLKGDTATSINLITHLATPLSSASVNIQKANFRRDPAALLLTALSRAETLRSLGGGAITFADSDGAQLALYFDPKTHLLAKYETLGDNPILGDALTEVVFSDYRRIGDVKLPFRVVNRTGGELVQDLSYSEIKINTNPSDSVFEFPAGMETGTATGPATNVEMTKLADGVYLAGGSSHNSLLVVFSDHLLLVEGPQSDERSQAVMAKLAEIAPGKPIRYLVSTHHHWDHLSGIRAYIASGATIVTTPGDKNLIERVAAKQHTIKPDSLSLKPRKPAIETFTKKKVFSDGARTVELYDLGPNSHCTEIVAAYLPKEKLIFVSDLFSIPSSGPIPEASPSTREFASKIKELGIDVERIAPAHGKVGTVADLDKALGAQAAAN
jgi:glyoxylase-like metal-dependent hydrolase (beta-lactamase superfamily II)